MSINYHLVSLAGMINTKLTDILCSIAHQSVDFDFIIFSSLPCLILGYIKYNKKMGKSFVNKR